MNSGPIDNIRITVVHNADELRPHWADLQDLAGSAIEPNVFYEPWMLEPALKWLAVTDSLRFVLIHVHPSNDPSRNPVLIAFFPLEVRTLYNHFPVRTLRLWKHRFCYLCTPILRRANAREALNAFVDWISAGGCEGRLVEFGQVSGEGPVHDLLVERLWTTSRAHTVDARWVRPCLTRAAGGEAYIERAMSARHRKDLEKKERKLRQTGRMEWVQPACGADVIEWTERFITMEANGWRGQRGVAFASDPAWAGFFRDAMNSAWAAGRLEMIGLSVDSLLIAIKVNLWSPTGSFAFVITYDESFSSYSPGLLLEAENVRRFQANPCATWMDSCADQNSPLFTRVWTEKRTIETLLMSTGSRLSDFWVGAVPFGHFLRKTFLPGRAPEHDDRMTRNSRLSLRRLLGKKQLPSDAPLQGGTPFHAPSASAR